ncbi:MAG: hypothetical protein SPL47_09925 [Bacteroidales bacterium]|nr:hypothetical protein [Bacteroidales bacterium]
MNDIYFKINDLVRIKEQEYNRIAKDVIWKENVFRILSLNESTAKLSDIENDIPLNSLEPIPIDGVADASIYYEPAIAADIIFHGEPIPVRQKNTSYYVDGFDTVHVDNHTLKDEFLAMNFKYVHEVQRWLHESGSRDELRVNQTLKV